MLSALDALGRLRDGNARFASGVRSIETLMSQTRRADFVERQQPFAVILGCSDSRVPVEIVFDQGLGDLFVIRVAGNVAAPSQVGSVEFAADQFGVQLVVVLGHTFCSAVDAAISELSRPTGAQSPLLHAIVDRIRPSVEGLLETELVNDPKALAQQAIRSNVRMSASALRHGSQLIERMVDAGELLILGAEYSLETGCVEFFDGLPPAEVDG
jgi:carbonic anhydrase